MSNPAHFDVARFTRLTRVSAVAPSPCGRWLVVAASRLSDDESRYISDLWRLSLTKPDAEPIRLTYTDSADSAPRFRADGALGFVSDRPLPGADDDDSRAQVWLFPPDGGEPRPLTDEPLGVMSFRFGGDRVFAAVPVVPGVPVDEQRARARDRGKHGPSGLRYTRTPVRQWNRWTPEAAPHIACYEADGTRRDLTPDANWEHRTHDMSVVWDASPTGRHVVVATARPGATVPDLLDDSCVRVIEVESGASADLGAAPHVTYEDVRFSPDGSRLVCVRERRSRSEPHRVRLWLFDGVDAVGADGEPDSAGRALAPNWDRWPQLGGWTPAGDAVIATADDEGYTPVFAIDVDTGAVTRVSAAAAGGSHTAVHAIGPAPESTPESTDDARDNSGDDGAGTRVVGLRHRLVHPPEAFVMDLAADQTPRLLAPLSGLTVAEGEAIMSVASFTTPGDGGAPVQSFVVGPAGPPAPRPTMVWIHGGPMSQNADEWHWRWNPMIPAAAGYTVVLPNPRGSTGFGQVFIDGVWGNSWGAACYRDILAVTDAACERPDVDADRIAAMGGSFGGYMTNWIGANTDRYRCLVSHAGIFDLGPFWGVTDYPGYFAIEMGTSRYDDPAAYDLYSPHRGVERWKTPTLIIHGEKDYRVPIGEALALFHALLWRGVEAELLAFPDEDHWITRPRNTRQWYETVLAFTARHLAARDAARAD